MVLLDDEFKPTGIRETFSLKVLTGPNWFFIAEGEKKYQHLRPLLDRLLADQPQKPAAAPAEAPRNSEGNWWEGGGSGGPPANPFELKKAPKKPTPKKGGWWDK